MSNLFRKSHFLGSKIRTIRKSNKLTLEDLSERCSEDNPKTAPSVSYLSMIENGKRLPSDDVLELIANIFQKEPEWFLDENLDISVPIDETDELKHFALPLEPGFLYSKELLQGAIPELLEQTGISGKQFAQLLIRSYQEINRNRFPDLERAAEEVGNKKFPLNHDDLKHLYKKNGLKIKWFSQKTTETMPQARNKTLLRSFFESPSEVYVNKALKQDSERLKYDLSAHLGHKILHQGDGLRSAITSGDNEFGSNGQNSTATGNIHSQDVLSAWHDFESSFFAGALLCPKKPFYRYLVRNKHQILPAQQLKLSPALLMRRVTAVSSYTYWHYFEAYQPGYLTAVYRGNGIPLPWGNMTMVSDPCPNWAVFRLLNETYVTNPQSQISILKNGDQTYLYCCHTIRVKDLAGNLKLLSLGIDLIPALRNQGIDGNELLQSLEEECQKNGGEAELSPSVRAVIEKLSHILRIQWLGESINVPARIICPRSLSCQRNKKCIPTHSGHKNNGIESIREDILKTEN